MASRKEPTEEEAEVVMNVSEEDRSYFDQQQEVATKGGEKVNQKETKNRTEPRPKKRKTSDYVPAKEGGHKGEGGWVSQTTDYTMENLVELYQRDYIKEMTGSLWD